MCDATGNLPLGTDPKLLWARGHPGWFPVEVNRADPEALLQVPGIGPCSATRIVRIRQERSWSDLEGSRELGVSVQRAVPFVLLKGRCPPLQSGLALAVNPGGDLGRAGLPVEALSGERGVTRSIVALVGRGGLFGGRRRLEGDGTADGTVAKAGADLVEGLAEARPAAIVGAK